MPVKVTLFGFGDFELSQNGEEDEQSFTIKDRHDYAKVGFAAARWARQALRGATLGEGGARAQLTMEIDFLGDEEPEPAAKPAKKRRRKKGGADGAES